MDIIRVNNNNNRSPSTYSFIQENCPSSNQIDCSVIYSTQFILNFNKFDSIIFHYALKGDFVVKINKSKEFMINEGDFFISKGTKDYQITNSARKITSLVSIAIPKLVFKEQFERLLLTSNAFQHFLREPYEHFCATDYDRTDCNNKLALNSILNIISNKDLDNMLDDQEFLYYNIKNIIIYIDYKFCSKGNGLYAYLIKKYVDENLANITLEALAEHLNISYIKLHNHFPKIIGKAYKDYIRETRLKKGKELLETTKAPIMAICEDIGMEYSYFFKIFKATYGYSPRRYRYAGKN